LVNATRGKIAPNNHATPTGACMRVYELILRLQSLPKKMQQLPVVTYEGSFLLPVEDPRLTYRDRRGAETRARRGKRVIIL
jgi:hypothetical protein